LPRNSRHLSRVQGPADGLAEGANANPSSEIVSHGYPDAGHEKVKSVIIYLALSLILPIQWVSNDPLDGCCASKNVAIDCREKWSIDCSGTFVSNFSYRMRRRSHHHHAAKCETCKFKKEYLT